MNNIKNFNAKEAKNIVDSLYINELHDILSDIKSEAEQGETVLHIYKRLNDSTINALQDKGFEIIKHNSIAVQKDELYYSIYWDK